MSHRQSNTLGLVGFILSIVGLLSAGCLSPLGLLLSLIGLFKEPRGFAIAGLILGLIGSAGFIIFGLVFGTFLFAGIVIAAAGGAAMLGAFGQVSEFQSSLDEYYEANGVYPYALEEIDMDLTNLENVYGGGWAYERSEDGQSFSIDGPGPDGQRGTEDDFSLDVDPSSIVLRKGEQEIHSIQRDLLNINLPDINANEPPPTPPSESDTPPPAPDDSDAGSPSQPDAPSPPAQR
ncbi:MAG: hypothetical protein AAGK04_01830 [Planctomycetota bacterium]